MTHNRHHVVLRLSAVFLRTQDRALVLENPVQMASPRQAFTPASHWPPVEQILDYRMRMNTI